MHLCLITLSSYSCFIGKLYNKLINYSPVMSKSLCSVNFGKSHFLKCRIQEQDGSSLDHLALRLQGCCLYLMHSPNMSPCTMLKLSDKKDKAWVLPQSFLLHGEYEEKFLRTFAYFGVLFGGLGNSQLRPFLGESYSWT